MTLSEKEQKFLENRRKLSKFFPFAGGASLALILSYTIWIYYNTPLLINPKAIQTKLLDNTIEKSTLTLMAFLLPWAMLALLIAMIVIIAFAFSWHIQEKKYLKIIDRIMPE